MRIIYLLTLILASIPAAAQTDIRLTAPNRIVYPPNLNYQQLARIGTRSLLVFGSTTTHPVTATTLPLIRVQLLEGNQPVGAQRNLTSDTASRPTGIMRVLAGVDRFLVFFNDLREDRPGLYLQTVGTDGANIGAVQFFSARQIGQRPPELIAAGSATEGYLIIWNDLGSQISTTYARRIDPQGTIDGPEFRIGGAYGSSVQVASLPDLSILYFPQDTSRLVHANGRIDSRPVPTPRLGVSYFIGSDTSIATIEGNSVKIYTKIFDQTAAQTIPIPVVPGIIDATRAITRNASGQLLFYYERIVDTVPDIRYAVERITLGPSGPSAPQRLLDTVLKRDTVAQMISSRVTLNGATGGRLCLQRYVINHLIVFETVMPDRTNRRFGSIGYTIDEAGNFSSSTTPLPCTPAVNYSISRLQIDSLSRVIVRFGADSVLVEHKRSQISIGIPERFPNIFNRTGKIYTTWTTTADSATTLLQNLDGTLSDTPTVFASYTARGRAKQIPGAQLLVSQTLSKPNDTTFRSQFGIQVASIAGWALAIALDQQSRMAFSYRLDDAAVDPNRNEIVALISRLGETLVERTSIYGVDFNGEYLWRIDSLPISAPMTGRIDLIPSGEFQYIVVNDRSATRFNRENVAGTFSFATSWPNARYQRLMGDRFLRWQVTSPNRDRIETEVYSVTGELLHSQTFTPGIQITGDAVIVENPATSALAILYAGAGSGIRVFYQESTFDGEFLHGAVSANTTTAINPAGAWLDDTLQVVWEDLRSGEPDIYGTWWTPSRAASVRERSGIAGVSLAVVPNPATGPITVAVRSQRTGTALLEIVDMRGRSIERREITLVPGVTLFPLDVTSLPAGAYTIAIGRASTRIIVQ